MSEVTPPPAEEFISTPPPEELEDLNQDELLRYTQRIRRSFVHETLRANRGNLPVDKDEQRVVLTALKDMDSQVLKLKSIDSKEKIAADDRLAAEAIERVRERMMRDPAAARAQAAEAAAQPVRPRPSITEQGLPELNVVERETAVGVFAPTFEEFVNQAAVGMDGAPKEPGASE